MLAAGGEGAASVFFALEKASECILDDSVTAVSSVVGHVAGKDAENITSDALGVAEDGFKLYKSLGKGSKQFGKAVGEKAAVQGAVSLASGFVEDSVRSEEDAAAGAVARRK